MKLLLFSCVSIVWMSNIRVTQSTDYDDIIVPKTKIEIITEKGKKWTPNLDYYCKYRIYEDYNVTPCFCMSMSLKFKYSLQTNKEVKHVEMKIPDATWVHGSCFSKTIYVTISWPKYNQSELLYFDPPKENFILMFFKRNRTHLWMDELSISMNHELGSGRRKNTVTISDTLMNLNFTAPVRDGIYVCERPIQLTGWTNIMEITIEDLRFLLYNGIRYRKASECPRTLM